MVILSTAESYSCDISKTRNKIVNDANQFEKPFAAHIVYTQYIIT